MEITALASPPLSLLFATGGLMGAVAATWAVRLPKLGLGFLFLSLVAGQLIRLPLPGQGGGLLLSDAAVVLVLLSAVMQFLLKKTGPDIRYPISDIRARILRNEYLVSSIKYLFMTFLAWSLFNLVIHLPELGLANFATSFSYWLRLTAYLLLLPALMYLFQDKRLHRFGRKGFLVAIAVLVFFGFLQLVFVPDFGALPAEALAKAGWDPHQFRLTSTWLDPNFFGGFLVVVMPWLIVRSQKSEVRNQNRFLVSSFWFLSLVALLLTRSRSAAVAFLGTALVVLPAWLIKAASRAQLMVATSLIGLVMLLAMIGALVFPDRVLGLVTSDATVAARAAALRQVWPLAQAQSSIGVGYNAYQFAALKAGLIGDFSIHSRAGADNSWLTLWVTTGIPGVILFAAGWLGLVGASLKNWLIHRNPLALAATASLVALFIHSQFVNSFLYGHLIITVVIILALAHAQQGVPVEIRSKI